MDALAELRAIARNPQREMVEIDCPSCRKNTGVGLANDRPSLPVSCRHCGTELDDRAVLMANLQLARTETAALADFIGTLLESLAIAYRHNPAGVRSNPVEALVHAVDLMAGQSNSQSVAAIEAAVRRAAGGTGVATMQAAAKRI